MFDLEDIKDLGSIALQDRVKAFNTQNVLVLSKSIRCILLTGSIGNTSVDNTKEAISTSLREYRDYLADKLDM